MRDTNTHAHFQAYTQEGGADRETLEVKRPQRRLQRRLHRRLEEVAKAVGGGYCRLQMPLKLAFAVGGNNGWA